MKLIKLTSRFGEEIYVNVDKISSFSDREDDVGLPDDTKKIRTVLDMGIGWPISVKETAEEILRKIRAVEEQ